MISKPKINKTLASCQHYSVEAYGHSRFDVDEGFFQRLEIEHDDGKLVLEGLFQITGDSMTVVSKVSKED